MVLVAGLITQVITVIERVGWGKISKLTHVLSAQRSLCDMTAAARRASPCQLPQPNLLLPLSAVVVMKG